MIITRIIVAVTVTLAAQCAQYHPSQDLLVPPAQAVSPYTPQSAIPACQELAILDNSWQQWLVTNCEECTILPPALSSVTAILLAAERSTNPPYDLYHYGLENFAVDPTLDPELSLLHYLSAGSLAWLSWSAFIQLYLTPCIKSKRTRLTDALAAETLKAARDKKNN